MSVRMGAGWLERALGGFRGLCLLLLLRTWLQFSALSWSRTTISDSSFRGPDSLSLNSSGTHAGKTLTYTHKINIEKKKEIPKE